MKVWIVIGYFVREYENVISAHSTEELARKQIENLKKNNDEYDGYYLKELTVDSA